MDGKEQNNMLLYIVILVGLVIIGIVKAVFASAFGIYAGDAMVPAIVTEVLGASLMFGLLVFIVQRVTAPYQSLADKLEAYGSEQERLRTVQEKMLATGVQLAAKAAPEPVVAAVPTPPPPPPAPPKDPLEAQLEQVIEDIHFVDMFAEYEAERNEALARGKGIEDDGGRTQISD